MCRSVVGCQCERRLILAPGASRVAGGRQEVSKLLVNLRGGRVVLLRRRGKVLFEKLPGQLQIPVRLREDTGCIDHRGVPRMVEADGHQHRGKGLVVLMMALVEVSQVDVGLGTALRIDGLLELCLGSRGIALLFGDHAQQAVRLAGRDCHDPSRKLLRFVESAADD